MYLDIAFQSSSTEGPQDVDGLSPRTIGYSWISIAPKETLLKLPVLSIRRDNLLNDDLLLVTLMVLKSPVLELKVDNIPGTLWDRVLGAKLMTNVMRMRKLVGGTLG